jgi:hypothetical protein
MSKVGRIFASVRIANFAPIHKDAAAYSGCIATSLLAAIGRIQNREIPRMVPLHIRIRRITGMVGFSCPTVNSVNYADC